MDIRQLWENTESLELHISELGFWRSQNADNGLAIILTHDPPEEQLIENKKAQLYFWNYIEHKDNMPIIRRRHQLGYVWFEKGNEQGLFSAPEGYTVMRNPDYETMVKERLDHIAGYLKEGYSALTAWIKERDTFKEIEIRPCTPLKMPIEIILMSSSRKFLETIERFKP